MDIKTILILTAFINALILIFLLGFIKFSNIKNQVLRIYVLSKIFHVIAWVFLILRGSIPDFLSIGVANVFIIFAFGTEVLSITSTDSENLKKRIKVFSYIGLVLALGFLSIVYLEDYIRIVYASIVLFFWHAFAGQQFLVKKGRNRLKIIIGIVYVLFSFIALSRAYSSLFIYQNQTLYDSNLIQQVTFTAIFLSNFIGIVVLLLLLKEKDERLITINKEKYINFAEFLPQIVFETDKNGLITYINRMGFILTGFSTDDLKSGINIRNVIAEEDLDRLLKRFSILMSGEIETGEEYFIQKKNGEKLPVLIYASPIVEDNTIEGMRGIIVDVSTRKKDEEKIKQLSIAVEQSSNTIVITNTHGDIEYVNPKFEDLTGYTPEEAVGQNPRILNAKTQPREYYKKMWEVITKGDTWKGEFNNKKKNGELFWESVTITPIKDDNGIVLSYMAVKEDITERRVLDESLKQRDKYLTALNKATNVLLKGDLIDYNRFVNIIGEASRSSRTYLFKNSVDENGKLLMNHIGEYCDSGIESEIDNPKLQNLSYDNWFPRWNKILSKGELISGKVIDLPINERKILERQSIKAILVIPIMVNDLFWGFVGFDNCVSDREWTFLEHDFLKTAAYNLQLRIARRRTQKLLLAENLRFQKTMDAMDAVVYVADIKTNELLFLNELGKKTWGDKVGQKCYSVLQEGQTKICDFCTNHLLLDENGNAKEPYIWEFQNTISKDWYQCRDQAIQWIDGRLVRMEIATVITQRKNAEQEIVKQNDKLKELVATKDKFFSIIAHDLRSPIGAMVGFSKLLVEGFDNFNIERQKEYITILHDGVDKTYKLLENLLLWSRSQQGTMRFNVENENLFLMYNETVDVLSQFAESKEIILKNKIPRDLFVEVDKDMLLTVLRNLISNAIKFTQKGGQVSINTRAIKNEENDDWIEVCVKDNGIGLSSEMKWKLFDITKSVTSKGTENESGTGLGLILCKEFIEKHGGEIWVESEIGKGSTFIFTLPLS